MASVASDSSLSNARNECLSVANLNIDFKLFLESAVLIPPSIRVVNRPDVE